MTRYADGPETEVELLIDAPADQVWAVLSDPAFPAEFSDELQEASWGEHADGVPGVGSTILGRNNNEFMGEWTTTSYVTEWEPGRRFSWAVGDIEDSAGRWRFDLEEQGAQTLVRQHYRIGPGRSGLSMAIEKFPDREEDIVANRLEFQAGCMLANLEGVKARVEAAS